MLAMTDGVYKYVGMHSILKANWDHDGAELMKGLRQRAGLARTGALQDDFTLIILEDLGA
jgi:ABC-type taurine transport system ATPase subunit